MAEWIFSSIIAALFYKGADGFTADRLFYIVRSMEIKNKDGEMVLHTKSQRAGVHKLKTFPDSVHVGDIFYHSGFFVQFRITCIDAIHLRSLKNYFRPYFRGAQSRRGIGGKIRVAGAAGENDYSAFFKVPDGAAPYERFGQARDFYR